MQKSHDLILDIGNSRTKFYLDCNSYFSLTELENALNHEANNIKELNSLSISSKHQLSNEIESKISKQIQKLGIKSKSFNLQDQKLIKNTYEGLGEDRLAKMIGAACLYQEQNIALIDFGSAVTLNLVDSKKNFIAGQISPSLKFQLKSLHNNTAELPDMSEEIEKLLLTAKSIDELKELSKKLSTTEQAMFLGSLNGLIGFIKESKTLAQQHFDTFHFICTGGDSKLFAELFESRIEDFEILNSCLTHLRNYNSINAS